ncbi:family 1 glycosylhydrolase [soil metagenome]
MRTIDERYAAAGEPRTVPIELLGAFESTFMPAHDRDVLETTEHVKRWRDELDLLEGSGVRRLRYPVRWHRIEAKPGVYDWSSIDEVMGDLSERGMRPIVDLLHHTSYPLWLGSLADPRFGPAYVAFVEAFAVRYPWVTEYTLCNEPFTTFLLCGDAGLWPPYLNGLDGFLTLVNNVLPAVAEASRLCQELLPGGRHVFVAACEHAGAACPEAEPFAALANDRRFFVTDLFLGRELDPDRPFVAQVLAAGGDDVVDMAPGIIAFLGLDYYAHCQWQYVDGEGNGLMTSPEPTPLADLIGQYWDRYKLPCLLGETNVRGCTSDRVSWLKYTLEQCERARDAGVTIDGYCWFPTIDSCDWDSLLARCEGNIDPVGVFWLDENRDRRRSSMSEAFELVARGAPSTVLPAYRFQPPVSEWLTGWLPQMSHWEWQDPPADEIALIRPDPPSTEIELRIVHAAE